MDVQMICEYISMADTESADRILDAVFARRRVLFPDWDMVYFALPKNDPEERKLVLKQALDILLRE